MYNAQITRTHKGSILLLIDHSGSMAEECTFEGKLTTKAEAVAQVANSLLEEIINRSHRERGIGDYFDVAVIGYGGEQAESLLGRRFKRAVELDSMYVPTRYTHTRHTLPSGECLEMMGEYREWIAPKACGRTPLGSALTLARRMVATWCKAHPESFPPIVINITDGEATDADEQTLCKMAEKLKSVGTADGNTLLFNIHIGTHDVEQASLTLKYPDEQESLPTGRHARLLYELSSTLPDAYNKTIADYKGRKVIQKCRAVCYNSSCSDLVALLNIGSISLNMMI